MGLLLNPHDGSFKVEGFSSGSLKSQIRAYDVLGAGINFSVAGSRIELILSSF
ncbi:MAG: hypothetical protein MRY83_01630 [Flavobacteriales bacterium]|nr:hypothetical protein [Flavobacteriales bacterium]